MGTCCRCAVDQGLLVLREQMFEWSRLVTKCHWFSFRICWLTIHHSSQKAFLYKASEWGILKRFARQTETYMSKFKVTLLREKNSLVGRNLEQTPTVKNKKYKKWRDGNEGRNRSISLLLCGSLIFTISERRYYAMIEVEENFLFIWRWENLWVDWLNCSHIAVASSMYWLQWWNAREYDSIWIFN